MSNLVQQSINKESLPSSLKTLHFGICFDGMIEPHSLPDTITRLIFKSNIYFAPSSHFNKPLQHGSLPSSLTELRLSSVFNHELPIGVLPQSLTTLIFGEDYTRKLIDGALPQSLTDLEFSPLYEHGLPLKTASALPGLKKLKMSIYHSEPLPMVETLSLCDVVDTLIIGNNLPSWPPTLTCLTLSTWLEEYPHIFGLPKFSRLHCIHINSTFIDQSDVSVGDCPKYQQPANFTITQNAVHRIL
ncbi:hypothetical protein SAMD00019534_012850 [Acytostelium subglobosum LB1]|uniref:hypothetical protein n=1 Tax=Acytostelium subglobosum LB1 TaxID=1410327 RepID=UPI000644A94B|nr:hypothetical protein SAMD00019534_012850 [Acytostelium subglobosum LB1]GAM18110.1 hypothetical protein SAMD00019534_012850 [Acytostelium subglobosum LB1]|eukprot:XP_012758706.1 hypothetical protein SAMD00019534_012850 [Acytostelium subglobosum LB1]